MMNTRLLYIVAGLSYLGIFFLAIYANFFVIDSLLSDPLKTVTDNEQHVRFGAVAFLFAAVLDVIVAWILLELYKNNPLTLLSTYFRLIHAAIMGAAVFALIQSIELTSAEKILEQVDIFNTLWLIGLFFFGFHLILLSRIVKRIRFIPLTLAVAGAMYILDTTAHFTLQNYDMYADIFLIAVAVPAILGEMLFTLWLLFKGGKNLKVHK